MAKAKSKYPVKPTVQCDTRETYPFFEESAEGDKDVSAYIRKKIDAGDYTVVEIPNLVIIERKADGKELHGNCILKKDRFMRSIEKMRAFKHKYIIIQQTYAEFLDVKNWAYVARGYPRKYQAIAATESWLISLSQTENIHFIWAGKKNAPKLAKKILIKSYQWERQRLMREDNENTD